MRYAIKHRNPGRSRGAQHVLFASREEALEALHVMLDVVPSPSNGFKNATQDWQVVQVDYTPRAGAS